jgi:lipoate-protein ligase A
MFIEYEVKTGAENMQIDSDLLDFAVENRLKEPIFRLYGWSPACVSLGRNQREFLEDTFCDTVRRLTGGRALLHDDEITYSFICPVSYLEYGENVTASYKEISQILINGLAKLGIELTFGGQTCKNKSNLILPEVKHSKTPSILAPNPSLLTPPLLSSNPSKNYCMLVSTGADLCYEGKKLIGSAQFRKDGYILQHGSILYDYDPELLEKIFNEPVDSSAITCIKEINPAITRGDIIGCLADVVSQKEKSRGF